MRDCIKVNRHNQGFATQTRGGKCSLTARMPRPDDYHVIFARHFKIGPQLDTVERDNRMGVILQDFLADENHYDSFLNVIFSIICA